MLECKANELESHTFTYHKDLFTKRMQIINTCPTLSLALSLLQKESYGFLLFVIDGRRIRNASQWLPRLAENWVNTRSDIHQALYILRVACHICIKMAVIHSESSSFH